MPVQFVDESGDTLVSGTLEFYLAGTTTATDLYSDSSGTSIGTSITLNARGMPESGGNIITLFRDQSKALKIVGKDAVAATIFTTDNIPAVASFDSASSTKLDLITVTQPIDLDALVSGAEGAYLIDGTVALTADIVMPTGLFVNGSTAATLTAGTTQTQADGFPLLNQLNQISVCANDNDTVILPEALAGRSCVVVNDGANILQVFPAVDDSIDSGAVDASVTIAAGDTQVFTAISAVVWKTLLDASVAVVAGSTGYGSMYEVQNATAYTVHAQTDMHCYHTATMADGGVSGWTFDAGSSGLSVAIASIADGAATGVDIEVTTTGNHGLTLGDVVSQTALTSAVYTGIFVVKAIISATQYEVAAVYTATDTGFMDAATTLTCVNAGTYILDWSASCTGAASSEEFDYFAYLNAAVVVGSETRRKFGTGGDYGAMTGTPPAFTAAVGDKVSWALSNVDSAANITVRNLVVRVNELV
jgi:hypothetical protein